MLVHTMLSLRKFISVKLLKEELDVNITPLIDVVFLLLIFFMVTTTFQKETELKINLPEAEAQAANDDKTRPLEVIIDAQGRYFIDGKELLNANAETLRKALQSVTVGNKDRLVIIRGDSKVDFQAVVTAMDVMSKLGLVKMSIATSEPKNKP